VANSATERTAVKIKQPLDKRGRGPCLCSGRSVGAFVGPTDMGSNALRSRAYEWTGRGLAGDVGGGTRGAAEAAPSIVGSGRDWINQKFW
jgi:hypothetical protein